MSARINPAQLPGRSSSRREPCPNCGGTGCLQTYPHDQVPHTYCFRCGTWTALGEVHHRSTSAEHLQKLELEQEQRHKAALLAQAIWAQAKPANPNHPYLVRKNVPVLGIRQRYSALLIPVFDMQGMLWNVQRIYSNGAKYFLKNGRKRSCFFVIGQLESAELLVFCEGYSTGATIHLATGYTVIVCFDAGNLVHVAGEFYKNYPDKTFVFCADNDLWDSNGILQPPEKNTGVVAATKAGQLCHGILVVPEFQDISTKPTDFNDMSNVISLDEVRQQIAAQIAAAQQPALELNPYRGSDDANASLLLELHGTDIRFCCTWEKWLVWAGSHWAIDDNLDIFKLAADVPKSLYQSAADCDDSRTRRSFAELAHRLELVSKRNAMLYAARHRVAVRHSELDTHQFLLTVSNGIVNLKTGKLLGHERNHLLTHITNVAYDQSATAPTWLRFLEDVFQSDAELIAFVQKAVGYSLTGDVREQVLFISHGVGSNGKSVFLNILRKLLGSLALQAAPDLLMADKTRRHPTEQADLFGKRLVVCQETEENRRFNEVLVKQLTGGEYVRARRMHEDFWEFAPTWKLWISTNYRPEIRSTNHAIWRRIRLIKFNVKFHDPGEGLPIKDLTMEAQLTAELSGILAWAVAGCQQWQRDGLQMPTAVRAATDQYKQECDVLAAFIAECCVTHKHCETSAADLYLAYTQWCERSGEFAEKQRKFGMRLTERGFERFSGAKGYSYWRGIGLTDNKN